MIKIFYGAAVAAVSAAPLSAASFDLDYDLSVTATQQRVNGVLQPLVQLPSADHRSYSGTLRVNFGAITEILEDGPSSNTKTRVQSVAVTYDAFSLAPDLLPLTPVSGLPTPAVRLESIFRVERSETNGIADGDGAYRLRSLAWTSDFGSAAFDLPTLTTHRAGRTERIFDFGASGAFRFGSLAPADIASALEAAQYRTCGNPGCAFAGALAWSAYTGDETATLDGPEMGVANLRLGTLTFSNARAAVPEPGSWAMMIAGFGLVGAGARRTRTLRYALAPSE